MVGTKESMQDLSRLVGIGSRLHDLEGLLLITLIISSSLTGLKDEIAVEGGLSAIGRTVTELGSDFSSFESRSFLVDFITKKCSKFV